ncbi:SDR family oxidoreductase (plasmid) [Gemmobacter fulvus]|uniref:Peroxisomal trans-2-enoyl-CoA reductase n=1 Tax=Gemmobacter fulvus TaxID=2840474 RepID=A0A975PB15_9RHOB|nr:SDR family oxidoreductase [Gemmobacter fulvus]QWK92954.1 SDR family oxidoreductase [Gemmobacter fulvus]
MTRTAASELGEFGVRVNAICPGTLISELTAGFPHFAAMLHAAPARRHGDIDEISKAVLFLASRDSTFINGVAIPVDGGFTAAGPLRLVHRLVQSPKAIAALDAQTTA